MNETVQKGPNEKFCSECGAIINAKAEICPKCGVRQMPIPLPTNFRTATDTGRSRIVTAFLAFFLGGLGVHKFYLGKIGWGIVYLIFCWTLIPSIVALIESIIFFSMNDEEFNQKYGTTELATTEPSSMRHRATLKPTSIIDYLKSAAIKNTFLSGGMLGLIVASAITLIWAVITIPYMYYIISVNNYNDTYIRDVVSSSHIENIGYGIFTFTILITPIIFTIKRKFRSAIGSLFGSIIGYTITIIIIAIFALFL